MVSTPDHHSRPRAISAVNSSPVSHPDCPLGSPTNPQNMIHQADGYKCLSYQIGKVPARSKK